MGRAPALRSRPAPGELRLPRRIAPGATIGIAAPAGVVDPVRLAAGEASLRAAGFVPGRPTGPVDGHRDGGGPARAHDEGDDADIGHLP